MAKLKQVNIWWLNNPGSEEDKQRITAAIKNLKDIPGVLDVAVGENRIMDFDGPDKSFNMGMVVTFESPEAQAGFGPHPIHQETVKVIMELTGDFKIYFIEER